MFLQKRPASHQPVPLPPGATPPKPDDSFEVDLKDALAHTDVHELSFEEFRRALMQQGRLKPQ